MCNDMAASGPTPALTLTMKRFVRLLFSGFCLLAAGAGAAADNSPLHDAVAAGDRVKVEALLARGADLSAKDEEGKTALDYAEERDALGNRGYSEEQPGNDPLNKALIHDLASEDF